MVTTEENNMDITVHYMLMKYESTMLYTRSQCDKQSAGGNIPLIRHIIPIPKLTNICSTIIPPRQLNADICFIHQLINLKPNSKIL